MGCGWIEEVESRRRVKTARRICGQMGRKLMNRRFSVVRRVKSSTLWDNGIMG